MTMSEIIEKASSVAKICSTCQRRKVGAIIVSQDEMGFVIGYNHSTKDCNTNGCLRATAEPGTNLELCAAIHAEVDAIERCKRLDINMKGAHLHVTHQPCNDCALAIIEAGITKVTYSEVYPHSQSIQLLTDAGIEVIQVGMGD